MNKIAVIGVPSSAGARHVGQEGAPSLFRRAGLIEGLRAAQLEVVDLDDLPQVSYRPDPRNPKQQNLTLVCDVAKRAADQVGRAIQAGAKPVVLGGDCTITIGVLAGLVRHFPDLGLIYFDGDIDLNTPAETSSGILDGMGMAHIIGKGAEALAHLGPRCPLMPEQNIVLFGDNPDAGYLDDTEIQRLQRCSMARYPVPQIRTRVAEAAREAVQRLEERVARILVHFDVDVIEFQDFPVADVGHDHGLTFAEAMQGLQVFLSSPKFAGLVVTEFNAERDVDGSSAVRLVTAIAKALGDAHLHWKESNVVHP